jgi:hypothetical protein
MMMKDQCRTYNSVGPEEVSRASFGVMQKSSVNQLLNFMFPATADVELQKLPTSLSFWCPES